MIFELILGRGESGELYEAIMEPKSSGTGAK